MLLSIDQFAERVGVHPTTLRRWLKAGGHLPKPLPVKAIGGGPLWRSADVEKWRDERVRGALPEAPEFPFVLPEAVGDAEPRRPRLIVLR